MKYYIVCSADNIEYDLTVSKPVTTHEEAQRLMLEDWNAVISNLDANEIESKNISDNGYRILCTNADVYYGQIKEIEVL